MGLKHVVITSVNRDELSDGGGDLAETIIRTREVCPNMSVEVLIPDFEGNRPGAADGDRCKAAHHQPQPGDGPSYVSGGASGAKLTVRWNCCGGEGPGWRRQDRDHGGIGERDEEVRPDERSARTATEKARATF